VVLEYIQGLEKLNTPTDTPLWKQAIGLPLPIVISLLILLHFRNKSISRNAAVEAGSKFHGEIKGTGF
jgi:hypothetical protein